MSIRVAASRELPEDFEDLEAAARAEGLRFLTRLAGDWARGSKRFDGPGEVLFLARENRQLVAVGGLTVDPFLDDPQVGRLRHLYVLPSHRGRGIGRSLATQVVARARERFERLRVRSLEAGSFYEALGFVPTDEPEATHQLDLTRTPKAGPAHRRPAHADRSG